jgi:alkylhydroperoxidase/carboxymuconolactone decarboxylase family protein YurZ
MGQLINDFEAYRTKMNDRIMETASTNIKRFFALDTTTYADGALDVKTKEMLGLVASMVLRCDDCIKYRGIHDSQSGGRLHCYPALSPGGGVLG